ncbi:MAG: ATP-binding protein [Chitinophagia bacterium]|nr:ATP-binding protein [Chitinophagia bacterium]
MQASVQPGSFTVSVRDNGPGVTDEEKTKMFNLFERLKYNKAYKDGYGIGLTIVKRLADKLSATVNVTSEPGEGMTISVNFPL